MIQKFRDASWKRRFAWLAGGLIVLFGLIQLVPFGRSHTNPPVTQAAVFPDSQSRQIFTDSCADCHSNLTEWPWYSNVAPMSWLVQNHVDEGRSKFNVSEWNRPQPELSEVIEQIRSGEMPPWNYTLIHRNADLTAAEKRRLIASLSDIYAKSPPRIGERGEG